MISQRTFPGALRRASTAALTCIALRLHLVDAAEHFRAGLEWSECEQAPIERGLCLQGLAEVVELSGDHGLATEYLDRAGSLFSQSGAKIYLEQVLAKKQILKA